MTEVMTKPIAIPQRATIDTEHTWNLSDIFTDDRAWETELESLRKLIDSVKSYAGRLAQSPGKAYNCLKERTELSRRLYSLYQYAYLNRDLDNRESKYQEMTARVAALSAEAGSAFSFVEPELLKIPDSDLLKMAQQFEKADEYDFYISELIRSRSHIRSEEVEELLASSSVMARGPSEIFSMLDDADLKYPSIKDEQGNEVQLTKQRYAKFLESSDRRVRRDANDGFLTTYKDHINCISASLSSSVNSDVFYTRARKFDSCLEGSLDGNNIPLSVYHSLLDTTAKNLDGLHGYVSLRKKLLNIDEMAPYDMYCPLFPDEVFDIPYDEAVGLVVESVAPLGEDYQNALKNAFANRWVDVYETEGKGSGAYNYGNFSVHPFVLMNYNNTIDSLFTLAHEMGHAMHSHFTCKTQPFPKSHYSIFVAEVASTLNEGLLLNLLLERAETNEKKLYLLNRSLDNATGTFFRQIMYANFELFTHETIEKGGALSPDLLSNKWEELNKQFYGPKMNTGELEKYKWARIPHFYNAFYVYQYATSFAASQAILKMMKDKSEGITERYLTLLSSGGKDHPINLLQACNVDMSTPAPVEATISSYASQVTQMEKLA